MDFEESIIPDVLIITPDIFHDNRGFFLETYRDDLFKNSCLNTDFVQDNQSGSHKGVLRGLHYQIQHPQGKIVRAVVGEIFDVAVDIRKSSSTFGKWVGVVLSAQNKKQLWIPPGFAHGLLVLSEWAEVVYKATDYYAPEFERSIIWNDKDLKIDWPLDPGEKPVVSAKDLMGKTLIDTEYFN